MAAKNLSRGELLARGWTERQIGLALDAADEYGPATHWLNPYGEPFYDADRVAIASSRMGLPNSRPLNKADALRWNADPRPTSLPVLSFSFHRLAAAYLPGSARELRGLRLSHPVMGRLPGTREKEAELVRKLLRTLLCEDAGARVDTWDQAETILAARADAALERFGDPWPQVVCRRAHRKTYISKSTGRRNLRRALDALALLAAGRVALEVSAEGADIVERLIRWPVMRFDHTLTQEEK